MKGAYHGEVVRFKGEVFHVRDYEPWLSPYRDNLEIFYGAFSETTFELAGEIADGIAPIFVPLEFVPVMKEAVARGALKAGRDPAEIDLGCYLPTAVSDDVEKARLAAKYDVAIHMSSYAYYRNYFSRRGMADVVKTIVDKVASADMAAAAELVEDEMVDAVTVYGTRGGLPGEDQSLPRCGHHTADHLPAPSRFPQLFARPGIAPGRIRHGRRSRSCMNGFDERPVIPRIDTRKCEERSSSTSTIAGMAAS